MGDSSRSGDRQPSSVPERVLAGLAAVAVLALALAGADGSRALNVERRANADRATVAAVAAGVAVDLELGLDEVGHSAEEFPSSGESIATSPAVTASIPGVIELGFVPADGPLAGAGGPLSTADRADPAIAALLNRARDVGDPAVSNPQEVDGDLRLLLVAAAYAPGARPGPPHAAPDRRARMLGWMVASVDLEALMRAYLPEGGVATASAKGQGSARGAGAVPERLPDQTIEVHGRVISIRAGDPSAVPLTAPTVLFVLAGLLGGGALAVGMLVAGRRLRSQRLEIEESTARVRLVGDVAPLVQQSLDLGEVLPAVAVQLSDHFGLAGVRLLTGSSTMGQLELFSLGRRATTPSVPVLNPPRHVATGEAMTLALQRGGRSVALLEVVAGRDLFESDLQSLRAISELVTAAVVNASLYASQQTAVRRLRDLDALKTVFLSTASHELRTPATAIGGFASLLVTSWDRFTDEQRRDFAERIAANARSLSSVVQDLLDFSMLDRGAVPVALVEVDLPALVEGVVDRLAPMFTHHGIACTTVPSPVVAGEVNGLERVVTNLLTNAVKFSPDGSTVTVSVGPDRGGVTAAVSDEGPGVPAEERQRIFTRFYRGAGEAVVQTRGVGIGLSVVAELLARMDGEITVDDAPGGGARFTVWLPARAPSGDGAATQDREVHDAATR